MGFWGVLAGGVFLFLIYHGGDKKWVYIIKAVGRSRGMVGERGGGAMGSVGGAEGGDGDEDGDGMGSR